MNSVISFYRLNRQERLKITTRCQCDRAESPICLNYAIGVWCVELRMVIYLTLELPNRPNSNRCVPHQVTTNAVSVISSQLYSNQQTGFCAMPNWLMFYHSIAKWVLGDMNETEHNDFYSYQVNHWYIDLIIVDLPSYLFHRRIKCTLHKTFSLCWRFPVDIYTSSSMEPNSDLKVQ